MAHSCDIFNHPSLMCLLIPLYFCGFVLLNNSFDWILDFANFVPEEQNSDKHASARPRTNVHLPDFRPQLLASCWQLLAILIKYAEVLKEL